MPTAALCRRPDIGSKFRAFRNGQDAPCRFNFIPADDHSPVVQRAVGKKYILKQINGNVRIKILPCIFYDS